MCFWHYNQLKALLYSLSGWKKNGSIICFLSEFWIIFQAKNNWKNCKWWQSNIPLDCREIWTLLPFNQNAFLVERKNEQHKGREKNNLTVSLWCYRKNIQKITIKHTFGLVERPGTCLPSSLCLRRQWKKWKKHVSVMFLFYWWEFTLQWLIMVSLLCNWYCGSFLLAGMALPIDSTREGTTSNGIPKALWWHMALVGLGPVVCQVFLLYI